MKVRAEIEKIATEILMEGLPADLCYHNYQHTREVVAAAATIGRRCGLSANELELVQVAGWLHDLGHTVTYQGHEEVSKGLALRILRHLGVDRREVDLVMGCIEATKMPQSPRNLLEQVVCDADLSHLAAANCRERSNLLRQEWRQVLGKIFTDLAWKELNIRFMTTHQYWTPYGKEVLSQRKQRNMERLVSMDEQRGGYQLATSRVSA